MATDSADFEKLSKELNALTDQLKKSFSAQMKMVGMRSGSQVPNMGQITSDIKNLRDSMGMGNSVFGQLKNSVFGLATKAIPLLGAAAGGVVAVLETLAEYVDKSSKTFQELSNYGAGFGGDMFKMRAAAAGANMSLDEFADFVKTNSELFVTLNGSVSEGAEMFGKISRGMRLFNNGALLGFGMNLSSINEYLGTYMDSIKFSDAAKKRSEDQHIQAAADLAMEMDQISKLTGKQRKQLQDEARRQAGRADVMTAIQELAASGIANAGENFTKFTTALSRYGEGVQQLGTEIFARGHAYNVETATLGATFKETNQVIMNARDSIRNGTMNMDDFNVDMALAMKRDLAANKELASAAYVTQNSALSSLAKTYELSAGQLASILSLNEEQARAEFKRLQAEAKQRSELTQGYATFGEVFRSITNGLEEAFLKSGLFENIKKSSGSIISSLTEYGIKFSNWIQEFFVGDGAQKMWDNIISKVMDLIGNAWNSFRQSQGGPLKWLTSDVDTDETRRAANIKKLDQLTSDRELVKRNLNDRNFGGADRLAKLDAEIDALKELINSKPSKATGGPTGNGGLTWLHPNEYVLSDKATMGLQNFLADMGRTGPTMPDSSQMVEQYQNLNATFDGIRQDNKDWQTKNAQMNMKHHAEVVMVLNELLKNTQDTRDFSERQYRTLVKVQDDLT